MSAPQTAARKTDLKALDKAGLERQLSANGFPTYRGRQIFGWLYGKGATSFEEMLNLPKSLRETLEQHAHISQIREVRRATSRDGTIKLLFELESGRLVESVLIPDFRE